MSESTDKPSKLGQAFSLFKSAVVEGVADVAKQVGESKLAQQAGGLVKQVGENDLVKQAGSLASTGVATVTSTVGELAKQGEDLVRTHLGGDKPNEPTPEMLAAGAVLLKDLVKPHTEEAWAAEIYAAMERARVGGTPPAA